eukprot:CAMPEP_0113728014 /NCGR_PEP_ID=MMETSP0038_2-20120614/41593_1 /TAXON_ID=2898 /ORGANISM="Cryptomonas paramecium" /LENGTH=272 /DNA_ID=CAMNT_0000659367 /DNA_START=19 /DNA_END=835 /DNA_ORIENTATION=+ /assembly_acc=CAM_ASM_000170
MSAARRRARAGAKDEMRGWEPAPSLPDPSRSESDPDASRGASRLHVVADLRVDHVGDLRSGGYEDPEGRRLEELEALVRVEVHGRHLAAVARVAELQPVAGVGLGDLEEVIGVRDVFPVLARALVPLGRRNGGQKPLEVLSAAAIRSTMRGGRLAFPLHENPIVIFVFTCYPCAEEILGTLIKSHEDVQLLVGEGLRKDTERLLPFKIGREGDLVAVLVKILQPKPEFRRQLQNIPDVIVYLVEIGADRRQLVDGVTQVELGRDHVYFGIDR